MKNSNRLKHEKAANATLIGGCGRSGTSILGRLIASFNYIEYYYDPALFHHIMYEAGSIPTDSFRRMFETYMYDELFMNSLAGRTINLNKHDGTYVGKVKSEEEISRRMSKSFGRNALEGEAEAHSIVVKATDVVFAFESLTKIYPKLKGVFIFRNPTDTLNSLLAKEWFSDGNLSTDSPLPLTAFTEHKGKRIPKWVRNKDIESWIESSELDRCAYYYLRSNKCVLDMMESKDLDILGVCYEDLIADSREIASKVSLYMNAELGAKTDYIIESIKFKEKNRDELLSLVDSSFRNKIDAVYQSLRHVSHGMTETT